MRMAHRVASSFPVFQFDRPTGNDEIGTAEYEVPTSDRERTLVVQIWYPPQQTNQHRPPSPRASTRWNGETPAGFGRPVMDERA